MRLILPPDVSLVLWSLQEIGALTSIRVFVVDRIKRWNLWYSRFKMGMASVKH